MIINIPIFYLKETATKENSKLKGKGTAAPTASFLRTQPGFAVLVSSFNHDELAAFRKWDETTPVAPLLERARGNILETATKLGASCINLSNRMAKAPVIEQCSEAGFPVLVYTVNQLHDAQRLKAMGVAGVFTDRPDNLIPVIAR